MVHIIFKRMAQHTPRVRPGFLMRQTQMMNTGAFAMRNCNEISKYNFLVLNRHGLCGEPYGARCLGQVFNDPNKASNLNVRDVWGKQRRPWRRFL